MGQVERLLAILGHTACGGVVEGEVRRHRDGAAGVAFLVGEFAHPADRPAHERGRCHEREVVADHGRQQGRDQAHIVEERQPGHTPVAFLALQRLDHLHDVGREVQMGDLHAGGNPGGAGGVLQVGDGVLVDGVDVLPGRAHLVGDGVDGDDPGALLGRAGAEELANTLGGSGGGQDRRRGAVVEHRVQATDVTRFGRIEQRHRDPAGVERAEEGHQVFQVLRAQNRHPVARLGHLLQTGAHRAVARAEIRPAQFAGHPVAFGGEIEESVGQFVAANLGPPLHMLHHAGALGEGDASVLDERVMERHTTSPVDNAAVGPSIHRRRPETHRSYRGPAGRNGVRGAGQPRQLDPMPCP